MARHRFHTPPRQDVRAPRPPTAHFHGTEFAAPDQVLEPCPEHQADGAPCSSPDSSCDSCEPGKRARKRRRAN